jgi:hypothetical protein
MGEMRNTLKNVVVKPEGKRDLKDIDIAGRITQQWITKMVWTDLVFRNKGRRQALVYMVVSVWAP